MTKRDNKVSNSWDFYKLWWEYLKRSDKYKFFCEKYGDHGKNKFGASYEVFQHYMRFFGNVFKFDNVDEWIKTSRRKDGRLPGSRPVLDLRDKESYYYGYFKALTDGHDSQLGFPSQEKIWEIISKEAQYIFLAVPVVGREDMDIIYEQIKIIRNKYKKTGAVKQADKILKESTMPSTRIRYDELEKYLKVYDLDKNGLKTKEIIPKITDLGDGDLYREIRRFKKNARNIIKNVEEGVFPGKY